MTSLAEERLIPIAVIEEVAVENGVELHPRSVLLGYLFGRAVCEDRRLLVDPDHLRAYSRSLLRRFPGE